MGVRTVYFGSREEDREAYEFSQIKLFVYTDSYRYIICIFNDKYYYVVYYTTTNIMRIHTHIIYYNTI